ncbi:imidazole glycerol phosphate synthase subunit HisH [Urechidicola croceus]|uniref:Imidazole glycerol phosphate synthase subunit HisH n=1 Tax=Urechidicola croceus TaxID=1850246 RepID=A0A1D8P768_9FLAO|nr:imidazole glycerol phosphate synthase subunit HisH [Urechidicola croceus]AOW20425.1 imidazole glycerol phosphate synthase, glutamine amidotransferase subunit [Urechidicola croceus]
MSKIVIIDYGAGNVKSVQFALERLGYEAICSNDAEVIQSADKVIFPGVGEASSAMAEIKKFGLEKVIPKLKQPVLGICLGMQLMCSHSQENDTFCLDIFPMDCLKFNDKLKVPQIGWNVVNDLKGKLFEGINNDEYVYYVHSYYIPKNEYTIATTDYGLKYAGAIQKDNFYACQFHPEKSSGIGEQILKNFIELKIE